VYLAGDEISVCLALCRLAYIATTRQTKTDSSTKRNTLQGGIQRQRQ